MRHLKDHRKLGRTASHRKAMLRNMVTSLIQHERIETTLPKAKELRRYADRMVTLGKKGTLHARRNALRYVRDQKNVQKLFAELAVRFQDRNGGYTRIYHVDNRKGDNAPMAIIEYLGAPLRRPKRVQEAKPADEKKKSAKKAKKSLLGGKKKEPAKEAKQEAKQETKKGKSKKTALPTKKKKVVKKVAAKGAKGGKSGLLSKLRGRSKAAKNP
jgi:large subunit ribosomal protein L17